MVVNPLWHVVGATDYGLAASWGDGVGGSGNVPLAADTVYYSAGSDVISGTLNQSAVALTAIYETEGSSNRLGGTGAALQTGTVTLLDKGGYGAWYINGTMTTCRVRSGYLYVSGGTTSTLDVLGGEVVINSSALLTSAAVTVRGGGVLTIEYKSETTAAITVYDGVLNLYRLPATLVVNGGRVTIQVELTNSASTSVTQNGGVIDWRAGFTTTYTGNAGHLTFENQTKPITLTNSNFNGVKTTARTGANGLTVTYTNPPGITDAPDGGG